MSEPPPPPPSRPAKTPRKAPGLRRKPDRPAGTWYIRWTDADGNEREKAIGTDKTAAERALARAKEESYTARSGLDDPQAVAYRLAEATPLTTHLDAWHRALLAKGDKAKHADGSRNMARRIVEIAEAIWLSDLSSARIQSAIASLRAPQPAPPEGGKAYPDGRSLRTLNAHRTAICSFSRWAVDNKLLRADPLSAVVGYNANTDRRHDRRTISTDELRQLIRVAHDGPVYQKMTGPARSLLYRLAVATGLRYGELGTVAPASFDFSAEVPTVTVRAAYTKNGDLATQPLPHDVAEDLRAMALGLDPNDRLFQLPEKGAEMLRFDLDVAGIPYTDQGGLVYDFHALRCQCATLLDQAGVSPRVVQKHMRHSTLELTGRYTRPRSHDVAGAVASLPSTRPTAPAREAALSTGTGGMLARILPGSPGTESHPESPPVPADAPDNSPQLIGVSGPDAVRRPESAPDLNAPRRTRTYNPLIKSQLAGIPIIGNAKGLRIVPLPVARILPGDARILATGLREVNAAWPDLSEGQKAEILRLVRAMRRRKAGK